MNKTAAWWSSRMRDGVHDLYWRHKVTFWITVVMGSAKGKRKNWNFVLSRKLLDWSYHAAKLYNLLPCNSTRSNTIVVSNCYLFPLFRRTLTEFLVLWLPDSCLAITNLFESKGLHDLQAPVSTHSCQCFWVTQEKCNSITASPWIWHSHNAFRVLGFHFLSFSQGLLSYLQCE